MVNGKRDMSNNMEHLIKEFKIIHGDSEVDSNIKGTINVTDNKPEYHVPESIKSDLN